MLIIGMRIMMIGPSDDENRDQYDDSDYDDNSDDSALFSRTQLREDGYIRRTHWDDQVESIPGTPLNVGGLAYLAQFCNLVRKLTIKIGVCG